MFSILRFLHLVCFLYCYSLICQGFFCYYSCLSLFLTFSPNLICYVLTVILLLSPSSTLTTIDLFHFLACFLLSSFVILVMFTPPARLFHICHVYTDVFHSSHVSLFYFSFTLCFVLFVLSLSHFWSLINLLHFSFLFSLFIQFSPLSFLSLICCFSSYSAFCLTT